MRRATRHTRRWYKERGWSDLIDRCEAAGIKPCEFVSVMPLIPRVKLHCEDAKKKILEDMAKELFYGGN